MNSYETQNSYQRLISSAKLMYLWLPRSLRTALEGCGGLGAVMSLKLVLKECKTL